MNRIQAIMKSSFRGYRTNRGGRSSEKRSTHRLGEITMPQEEMFSKNFAVDDTNDFEDLDEFASDFSNVADYDKMHEREMEIMKDKVKTQIVKRKYFRSKDPNMLTWSEKEQIRLLHAEDPIKWSADALSESFPATRDTVLKVLQTKWSPKSVKVVTKYDEAVMKNWNLYKSGRLQVSAELQSCLAKFKDRKVKPMDPNEIAKRIIMPKPIFPKPKSKMFSNIIQSYLDANPHVIDDIDNDVACNETSIKKSAEQIASGESVANDCTALKVTGRLDKLAQTSVRKEPLTFNEFLKHRVENVDQQNIGPVDRVLIDEYKERKNEAYRAKCLDFESESPTETIKYQKRDPDDTKGLVFESESPVGVTKELEAAKEKFENITFTDKLLDTEITDLARIDPSPIREDRRYEGLIVTDKGTLETGIIARHKKNESLHGDYADSIKIPAKKYKLGVTYRVEDRYYDDDGEFLYRVVGLKS